VRPFQISCRRPFAAIESAGPALLHDFRQPLVCPDRRVLKLPRLLPGWRRSLPLELPSESPRKRSCDDTQCMPGELGILLGGFGESKAVQLRVDLNRLMRTSYRAWKRRHCPIQSAKLRCLSGTTSIASYLDPRAARSGMPTTRQVNCFRMDQPDNASPSQTRSFFSQLAESWITTSPGGA
jgi:hypothetical protein